MFPARRLEASKMPYDPFHYNPNVFDMLDMDYIRGRSVTETNNAGEVFAGDAGGSSHASTSNAQTAPAAGMSTPPQGLMPALEIVPDTVVRHDSTQQNDESSESGVSSHDSIATQNGNLPQDGELHGQNGESLSQASDSSQEGRGRPRRRRPLNFGNTSWALAASAALTRGMGPGHSLYTHDPLTSLPLEPLTPWVTDPPPRPLQDIIAEYGPRTPYLATNGIAPRRLLLHPPTPGFETDDGDMELPYTTFSPRAPGNPSSGGMFSPDPERPATVAEQRAWRPRMPPPLTQGPSEAGRWPEGTLHPVLFKPAKPATERSTTNTMIAMNSPTRRGSLWDEELRNNTLHTLPPRLAAHLAVQLREARTEREHRANHINWQHARTMQAEREQRELEEAAAAATRAEADADGDEDTDMLSDVVPSVSSASSAPSAIFPTTPTRPMAFGEFGVQANALPANWITGQPWAMSAVQPFQTPTTDYHMASDDDASVTPTNMMETDEEGDAIAEASAMDSSVSDDD